MGLCLADRSANHHNAIKMSPCSVAEYNYAIEDARDIVMEDLPSHDVFIKSNYFSHRARFKIALLDSAGMHKKGKSSYAHVGIDSDAKNPSTSVMTFRCGHPETGSLHSSTWNLARCKNCNSGRVVEIECADCKEALENCMTCKSITLDILLKMSKEDIQRDAGKVSFGYSVK